MQSTTIKIPAELFAVAESSHFLGQMELPILEIGPDDYTFREPLVWDVDVSNTGGALLVSGTVKGQATCPCARCLEDVETAFNGTVEGYYLIHGEGVADDEAYGDDDGEFDVLPDDHVLDIEPILVAALFVDAPEKPLCREDCAGLCPRCGANLNEGECGCGPDEALEDFERESNPFAALAGFSFE